MIFHKAVGFEFDSTCTCPYIAGFGGAKSGGGGGAVGGGGGGVMSTGGAATVPVPVPDCSAVRTRADVFEKRAEEMRAGRVTTGYIAFFWSWGVMLDSRNEGSGATRVMRNGNIRLAP